MLLTVSLVAVAVAALYIYLVWNFNYWKKRDVPGPDPTPLLGNFPSFVLHHRPIMNEMDKIYRDYKEKFNFVGVFSNRSPRIFVLSSGLAKDILIKDFKNFHDNEFAQWTDKEVDPILGRNPFMLNGEEWKSKRAEITPAFTTSRMKALFSLVEDVGSRMTKYINEHKDSPVETKELAAKFTTDVVSNCIFAADAQSFSSEKPEIREMGRKLLDPSFASFMWMLVMGMFPWLSKMLKIGFIPKSVEKFFTNLMMEAIRHREASATKRLDYLDYLISLRNKKEISELDMAGHGVTFFIDGFETSSVAMSFVLYEVARNIDVQNRLREELLKATESETIAYETLLELPYLDQVISEALRLWPPAAFLSKQCTEPIELDLSATKKILLDKNVCAIISIWSIHRDPKNYKDPLTFNPDRFSPEAGGVQPYREKGCFIPFGDGPRQCLGMRFARMQVKRGIYEIIKNFKISVHSKTKEPLQMDPKQFLTTAVGGIWLNFEPLGNFNVVFVCPICVYARNTTIRDFTPSTIKRGCDSKISCCSFAGAVPHISIGKNMLLTVSLISVAVAALYVYLVWNFNYWKKRDVPGPNPTPLLGNFPSLMLHHKSIMDEMDEIYREYKGKFNFVGVFSNRSPRIFVLSSAVAKQILTKDFKNFHDNEFAQWTDKEVDPILGRNPFFLNGEEWKSKRAEITPAFTTSRMKALFSLVEDVGSRMTKYINEHKDSPVETKELAAKFTTDVVSNCIFAADAQSFTSEKPEIREMGRKLMEPSFKSFIMMMFIGMFPRLSKILKVGFIPKSIEAFFANLMSQAIHHREASATKRVDYLDYLISLRNKKEISELDMAAHGVTFFIDGFETSSVAISFVLYEIARNPNVQNRLREELMKATAEDGTISFESLLELPYLDQVISETLRLWPPAAFISKQCTEPIELDLTPLKKVLIETNVCAIIDIWSIQRDPENYEDPLTFNPDRFSPETGGVHPYREKGCFLPFGEGPRQCLGMRFARMQVKRGIYEIMKNFKISVDSKTKEPLQMDPKQFLTVPIGGIWLNFEPIEN
ncbi:uncharacterized protein LOC131680542 [Topomyia yanbarensis]|uniref:uncharacterized protein LOC131680542 n=1 Tax=Topomyia yanbarensis TaxID=2498891 RepID=UPI00273A96F1|nr:uncharacterized protein LOC131680542 [Topomyia yanbarensis]